MAGTLKTNEVKLVSPNGLQEGSLTISDSGVVSSNKTVTLASPTITGTIPQEAWITPTLLNGWVNFGGIYETVAFMKDSIGFIHLKGMIKSGNIDSVAFILPTGYRPSKEQYLVGLTGYDSKSFTVVVKADGSVLISSSAATNSWVTINGITFKAEQ